MDTERFFNGNRGIFQFVLQGSLNGNRGLFQLTYRAPLVVGVAVCCSVLRRVAMCCCVVLCVGLFQLIYRASSLHIPGPFNGYSEHLR